MREKKTLMADELILGDPHGPHLTLSAEGIELVSAHRASRARLMFEDGNPHLILYDHNGQERLCASICGDGEPEIRLADGNGVGRLYAGVLLDGLPYLSLKDAVGKTRLELQVLDEGTPTVTLHDRDEGLRLNLLLEEDTTPGLIAFPPTGEEHWHTVLSALARKAVATTPGKKEA
jgi:hypothetical protein